VHAASRAFDLALSYAQWHGSGRSDHLARGAEAAAAVCGSFAPLRRVVLAGEGEAAGGVNRWSAILEQFRSAQAILAEARPDRLLTAGGDCGVDVAVIDYLHRRRPDLGVLWVDAHLDANTPATTPSGNFHGMPVAAILGAAPPGMSALLGAPLLPAQFRYVGAHVGDDGDWAFQREHALAWWQAGEFATRPIHIHFDLDALDPAGFPHVAYPDRRLSLEDGLSLVRSVAESGRLVGLTITEFAPADEAAAVDGMRFIRRLCEAAAGGIESASLS
jgi:arginase